MYCNSCGAENPDQAQFCSKCGGGLTVDDVPVVPEAAPAVPEAAPAVPEAAPAIPGAGTTAAAPAPIHLTEEDYQTAKGFAGLALFLVLFSVFGGTGPASWWIIHGGGVSNYGGDMDDFSTRWDFALRGMDFDLESDSDLNDEWKMGYSDSECECDEMEDLMGTVVLLGYLAILAAAFFVYAAFYQNDGRTLRTAALVMGGAGLLTAGFFAMTWTDAFDEESNFFEDADNVDKSFFGTSGEEGNEISWKPWLGWGAMLLSGFLGVAYYVTLEFD